MTSTSRKIDSTEPNFMSRLLKPIKNLAYSAILLWASTSFADDNGWTVGLGVVSSDLTQGDNEKPFFPAIQTDTKQFMFIPNLQYKWSDWSIGADGIGWQKESLNGLTTSVKVGFPVSGIRLGGQKGWFRYGVASALNYSDGLTTTQGLTLGPITYSATFGLNDRNDEFSHKASFGFPLYLNQKKGITVIGSAFIQRDNTPFSEKEFETTFTGDDTFQHYGANVFSVYKWDEHSTLLVSGTLQINDSALEERADDSDIAPEVTFNIFTLYSYSF
jgi:hypothetical protein